MMPDQLLTDAEIGIVGALRKLANVGFGYDITDADRANLREAADSLARLRAAGVEGWVLVPREPPAPMRLAGIDAAYEAERSGAPLREVVTAAYAAMLEASPPPREGINAEMLAALKDLEQSSSKALEALDKFNEEHGSYWGGGVFFRLGSAIAGARAALSRVREAV